MNRFRFSAAVVALVLCASVFVACNKEENNEVLDQFLPRFACQISTQPDYSTRASAWSLVGGRTIINATNSANIPNFNLVINGEPAVGTYNFGIDFDDVNVEAQGFYRINGSTNPDSAYTFKRASIVVTKFENNRITGTFEGVARRVNGDSLVISNGVLENIPKL